MLTYKNIFYIKTLKHTKTLIQYLKIQLSAHTCESVDVTKTSFNR